MAAIIVPLAQETRTTLTTAEAAHHLNRSKQTLQFWACGLRRGPITPLRVNGRLAWPVAEIKKILGLEG
jgi:hypothetical protein